MKGFILGFAVATILLSGTAYATSGLWFQTFFGHFAATLRFLQYGIATPGVNEIYVSQRSDFIELADVRLGTYCPDQETQGAYDGGWTFFGARFLPMPHDDGNVDFYGLSYLGANVSFHNGDGYDAFVSSPELVSGFGSTPVQLNEASVRAAHVAAHGYSHLTRSGHFAPLSWNAMDVDGDGKPDFAFGGMMYLSQDDYAVERWSTSLIGAEVAFIDTPSGTPSTVRAVRLGVTSYPGRLSVVQWEPGWGFREQAVLQISGVQVNAGHALVTLPGPNGDRIAVRQACGLQLYDFTGTELVAGPCINGLLGNWVMPGGRGDFTGDGVDDIWLSETNHGNPSAPENSRVTLIDGAALNAASGTVSLDSLKAARIHGSAQYSNYDGISTTMSPVAGDILGDGLPDFTFTGHRHMSEAGALYMIAGADITSGLNIDITDSRIRKVLSPPISQLAPPFHHWDATDLNGDGHDDIVITAVNDLCSGINAGAVYALSGKAINESDSREALR